MTKYMILAVIALSFLIYGNSLNNAFVSDDIPDILNNLQIANISRIFDLNSFSMSGITFTLNYLLAGYNTWIYHLTNIIIHALTSISVFFFLRLFFRQWPSFWGTLLFVVHPIHTENITWISGRGHAFFGLFVLISFIFYVKATKTYCLRRGYFFFSIAAYILSLYSCPFALLYPAMLILYDFTFREWRKHWRKWIVFFCLACFRVSFMIGMLGNRVNAISTDAGATTSEANFIFKMAYSIFSHLWLILWPAKLTLYHEDLTISMSAIMLEAITLVFIILLLPFIFRRAKVIFFAIGIFIIFLLPTYSPVTITWLVAERYLYFPSVALSIILAFLIDRIPFRKSIKAGGTLLIIVLIAYSVRTVTRNGDWKTRASLWRATVKVSPTSAKAHNNMGDIYSGEGNLREAVKSFKRAIELKPNYADAYHNLAHTYDQMGYFDEAIKNYKAAVAINKNLYQSYINLGIIYLKKNEISLAKEYFHKVLEINPAQQQVKQVLEMIKCPAK